MPLAGTLFAELVARGAPLRVDDVREGRVPEVSRRVFAERGSRAVALVPLLWAGGVFGAVPLASARAGAFDDEDVEIVGELGRPLASAIELRRLLAEGHRRQDELGAVYATSQLISARLEMPWVLDRISQAVSELIGSSGCGIGLLDPEGAHIGHVAAHGVGREAWRTLSIPIGEGIMGRAAQSGTAIRVDDVRTDPRSARRDVDEREGIRSMLCVPLKDAGEVIGVISAFATRPGAFTAHHQRVLEAFGEQAGIAIHNARLFEESVRRARERRAVQSRDLYNDPRARYPELARATGFRSMLAAPLRVGDRVIGLISVFRRDVHAFSDSDEELLLALADQAAIALEHARLYAELESMVAERTRELDAQKRFVEVVLETLPLGVFVLDAELGVVRANREGVRVLGCEPGARASFAALFGPGTAGTVEAFVRDAFATRRGAPLEVGGALAGATENFRVTRGPVEPTEASAPHAVVLVEDVTRAKRLERQMLLTERLTTAGRLAAGVAHELNNPLATIAGCAESLRERLTERGLTTTSELTDFPHYLGLIEEEAFRCKEITGTLLQFVRDPGSQRAPTDLNALVLRTTELLSHQSRFAEGRFATELDPALPPLAVNEGQLRQVFIALASNALEAMEGRGRLTVRSRLHRGEVEVEFEDEGPGVPDEIQSRIFDPFFTTKPPGQGTGLGLAIAQGIVTDHGGRIEVTSRPGKGSLFRVVLPA